MPKFYSPLTIYVLSVCGKTVEKAGKVLAQTFKLITYSTAGPLNISQSFGLIRFLGAGFAQPVPAFTQSKMSSFNLVGGQFYSFSSGPINTTKLNKDF